MAAHWLRTPTLPLRRLAVSLLCVSFARTATCTEDGERHTKAEKRLRQEKAEKSLRDWRMSERLRETNNRDPKDIDPHRRVVAIVGITGSGKSSTANTMMTRQAGADTDPVSVILGPPRQNKKFKTAASLTSVTRAVAYRDYDYLGVPYRIIDTPGLHDTNRSADDISGELLRFSALCPYGVSAFVCVVPRGRMTNEHENALRALNQVLGPDFPKHSMLVVTNALRNGQLLTREELLDDIDKLPPTHFLRGFVREAGLRVVAVENCLVPHRALSQRVLNQAVLDTLAANDNENFDIRQLLVNIPTLPSGPKHESELPQCTHTQSVRDGHLFVDLRCNLGPVSEMLLNRT